MAEPAMTVEELERFLAAEFPQVFHAESGLAIEEVWHGGAPRAAGLPARSSSGPAARSPARP